MPGEAQRCPKCKKPIRECWCFAEDDALESRPAAVEESTPPKIIGTKVFEDELKKWTAKVKPLQDAAKKSEQLTAADYAVQVKTPRVEASTPKEGL